METKKQPKRVVIYTRISSDPDDEEKGVERQEQDCLNYVKTNQMQLIGEPYRENNVSAWSGKDRPKWNAILERVEAGEIDGIVTWHLDRVVRRVSDLVDVIDLLKKYKIRLHSVTGGVVDLATSTGIMVAQIVTAVAEQESSHKGERVARAKRQHAEDGLPGSGPRPFGFQDDKITHHPGEAAALKKAVKEFIADPKHRLTEAVAIINEHGYPMTTRRLRPILLSGRIAGRRDYVSMEMRRNRTDGKSLRYFYDVGPNSPDAAWDEIISYDQWMRCRAILLDPARERSMPRRANSLLAGLIVCGECGGYMTHGGKRYQCNAGHLTVGEARACGKVSGRSDFINSAVLDLCKAAILDNPEEMRVSTTLTPNAQRRRELQDQRDNLLEAQEGLLELFGQTALARQRPDAVRKQLAELEGHVAAIDAQLAEIIGLEITTAGLDLRAELLDGDDEDTQRRIIEYLIQEVIIYRVGKGKSRTQDSIGDSWDVWWRGADRPIQAGKPTVSVRMESRGRK